MHYMLRKTLIPWKIDETIRETLEYCIENKIEEVVWKIDVEEFCNGFTSIELVKKYIPSLKRAKALFDSKGKMTSINPWMTLNHSGYTQNSVDAFSSFRWMVDFTGKQSTACPCPLCQNWQEHLLQVYMIYAEIKPHILWVEDDFRHFNHGIVQWGCFCQLHLDKFSNCIGKTISRQELVDDILASGNPHPLRYSWMEFLGQNMLQLASKLQKAALQISPITKIGLMCSSPDYHSIEGRKWHELIKSFSGSAVPVARPHFGPYKAQSIFDMFVASNTLRQTAYCLPHETMICPEVENLPYTEFAKSVKQTKAQILLTAALGYSNVTLNLYDHLGTSLKKNDRYGKMLKETKEPIERILTYCKPGGKFKGIGTLYKPDAAKFIHTEKNNDFSELLPRGNGWSIPLQALGFSTTYGTQQVNALTGQIIRSYNDLEIKQLLSKGLLLDASAAQTLYEIGYAEYIGLTDIQKVKRMDTNIAVEDGSDAVYMSARIESQEEYLYKLNLQNDAKIYSYFLNSNRIPVMPSLILYQNDLGGRIAIYARNLDSCFPSFFLNWNRQKQIEYVLKWLGKQKINLYVKNMSYCLPIRIDYDNYSIVALLNCDIDDYDEIAFEYDAEEHEIKEVLIVEPEDSSALCSFEKFENHIVKVHTKMSFNSFDIVVFCLMYQSQ